MASLQSVVVVYNIIFLIRARFLKLDDGGGNKIRAWFVVAADEENYIYILYIYERERETRSENEYKYVLLVLRMHVKKKKKSKKYIYTLRKWETTTRI